MLVALSSFRRKSLQLDRDAGRFQSGPLHPGSSDHFPVDYHVQRKFLVILVVWADAWRSFHFRYWTRRVQCRLSECVSNSSRPAHRLHSLQLPQRRSRTLGRCSSRRSTGSSSEARKRRRQYRRGR